MLASSVIALVMVVVAAAVWLALRADSDGQGAETPDIVSPPSDAAAGLVVESEREVHLRGRVVEVLETSRLVDGSSVQVVPPASSPPGLTLRNAAIVAPDGRITSFTEPVTLATPGSITVRGRYSLAGCPDLLPAQWPSPADFRGASRTYLFLDEPQLTVRALCPTSRSTAEQLGGLSGRLGPDLSPEVRLRWRGPASLTIVAVGSASQVAVVVPEADCDPGCVARIPASGSVALMLQAVDPCPPATTDDSLVLVVREGDETSRTVALQVPGLHRALCR